MSDDVFHPGDLAEVLRPHNINLCRPELRKYLGQCVSIESELIFDLEDQAHYHRVCAEDGVEFYSRPRALKKLPPPPKLTALTSTTGAPAEWKRSPVLA